LNTKSSKVSDYCLTGFKKTFPQNNFSMMTVTGAKGSNVNHSQVAVMLGQQEL
jgi:DNA-directed RNA polymerase I subunit RPA1